MMVLPACPSVDDLTPQTLALLPRGRAFGTSHGGPWPGTLIYQFWRAVSAAFVFLYSRICALDAEWFCATMVETRDAWLADYGLPDACDPYPDVCAKLMAMGGATCAYYAGVAAAHGWSVTCSDISDACGTMCGTGVTGCTMTGAGLAASQILIIVGLGASPAYSGAGAQIAAAGCYEAGTPRGCGPDLGPLECIMARVLQAHLDVIYLATP